MRHHDYWSNLVAFPQRQDERQDNERVTCGHGERDGHPVAAVAITFRNEEIDDAAQVELASATRTVAEAIGSRL